MQLNWSLHHRLSSKCHTKLAKSHAPRNGILPLHLALLGPDWHFPTASSLLRSRLSILPLGRRPRHHFVFKLRSCFLDYLSFSRVHSLPAAMPHSQLRSRLKRVGRQFHPRAAFRPPRTPFSPSICRALICRILDTRPISSELFQSIRRSEKPVPKPVDSSWEVGCQLRATLSPDDTDLALAAGLLASLTGGKPGTEAWQRAVLRYGVLQFAQRHLFAVIRPDRPDHVLWRIPSRPQLTPNSDSSKCTILKSRPASAVFVGRSERVLEQRASRPASSPFSSSSSYSPLRLSTGPEQETALRHDAIPCPVVTTKPQLSNPTGSQSFGIPRPLRDPKANRNSQTFADKLASSKIKSQHAR
ncbi:unnamed protein product [Protopolystoma xenopodis]|uniref:Uncharacterized protein n=1 Tax=Protopolystoma xenopodis TaxID=117903 RepID=A0A3S5CC36_9PLAT|nr:unnamed protein product [Protopolystoma xenopodis]